MSLGQLALSLTKDDISLISQNAFRLAVKQFSEVDGWSKEQKKAIISRAKVVWSQQVDQWDKDQVNELGPVLEAMSTTDIPKLRPEVVDVIPSKVFEDMSLPQLQAFSADQYNAMLTPQVQAISRAKRDSLTTKQQGAIKSVIASDPDEEDPWGPDDEDYCQGHTCSASSYVTVSYLVLLLVGPVGVLLR